MGILEMVDAKWENLKCLSLSKNLIMKMEMS